MLAVLVLNDSVSGLVEQATFCAVGDEKRPSLVGLPDFTTQQICPEDVNEAAPMLTDASPDTFYVRIMFDELLDPNIEDLIPILDDDGLETGSFTGTLANTQPVTLRCTGVDGMMHEIAYDGYYSPSGNSVTWPLGPSLVIKPLFEEIIPTNSMCEVSIKDNVKDKQGNAVPAGQRGPFPFKVSELKALFIDPEDGSEVEAAAVYDDGVFIQFNGNVDPASFCDEGTNMDECEFKFTPDLGPVAAIPLSGAEYVFVGTDNLMVETGYTFEITGGTIKDACGAETTLRPGVEEENTKTSWTTAPFDISLVIPSNGDVRPATTKPLVLFSNYIDATTVDASEITVSPAPTSGAMIAVDNLVLMAGHFAPETEYTLTIAAGATVSDVFGAALTAEERVIKWTTQPIAITASSPANGATVTKPTPTSPSTISFTFNQSMDAATWTVDDVELTGTPTTLTTTVAGCGATSTSCQLRVSGTFTPGTYEIKLKQGATIDDVLGNTYTQASDRVIAFTVKEADPAPPATPCLGE